MKKFVAMVMVLAMMLAFGATAFAAGGELSVEQAKRAALNYAGVNACDATFTKAHRDWDNGREVYEIEFYANGMEYDMDVDVYTGVMTDYSVEAHGGYGSGSGYGGYECDHDYDYDDDWDLDWDDIFSDDAWDDMFD